MEGSGGMVAVVRGVRDSAALAVTLVDGGNQYTLMPNEQSNFSQSNSAPFHVRPSVHCASQYTADGCTSTAATRNCDSGIQANDDRYATTYKTMHCNMKPTSPPHDLTEFPPQRPEVLPGHDNFVVGGYGSGETRRPAVKSNSFRGGMVWPDRGSVCESRASVQSDAFTNSLRKYPILTPERSSEIVERLISFTQEKNLSKNHNSYPSSPTRKMSDKHSSKQTFVLEENASPHFANGVLPHPEVTKNRSENASTRDRSLRNLSGERVVESEESWSRPLFCRNNDVRCCRDTARRIRQGLRNMTALPHSNFSRPQSSTLKDQLNYDAHMTGMYGRERESYNSVNMEIQAAAQMESKEILTLPRIVPKQRTIATALSPIPSKTEAQGPEGLMSALRSSTALMVTCSCKSIQVQLSSDTQIKTSTSTYDFYVPKYRNNTNKRSRSEEELGNIRKTIPRAILSLLQELNNNTNVNDIFKQLKESINKRKTICQNCKHMFDNFDILRRSVSNNTYFNEDVQFDNINKRQSFKHSKSRSGYTHQSDQKPSNEFHKKYDDLHFTKKAERKKWHEKSNYHLSTTTKEYNEHFMDKSSCNNEVLSMNVDEIRNLIELDILAFTEKYRINITTDILDDLIEELLDLFVMYLKSTLYPSKNDMSIEIQNILRNRGLSEFKSIYLTNVLTDHWEEEFMASTNLRLNSSNCRSQTLIVYPNISQDFSQYRQPEKDNNVHDMNNVSQKDIDVNVRIYIDQISNEINEWFLSVQVHQIQDQELRQSIVDYLATDIVDRHKYLELNPSSGTSDKSELEHLKYQIFKALYKFGVVDMALVDHAPDLIGRIKSVPVPIFSTLERKSETEKISRTNEVHEPSYHRLNVVDTSNLGASSSRKLASPDTKCCKRDTCKRNQNMEVSSKFSAGIMNDLNEPRRSNEATTSTNRMSSPGERINTEYYKTKSDTAESKTNVPIKPSSSTNTFTQHGVGNQFMGGIKIRDYEDDFNEKEKYKDIESTHSRAQINGSDVDKINAGFNQYLKQWVETIPMPITTSNEQIKANTARKDIYNGILDVVSKLRAQPSTFNDRFLFEDILDDEVEKLLSNVPENPEFNSKKYILKVKLLEKTNEANELMKPVSDRSYKQQLVTNLRSNLPTLISGEIEDPELIEIHEELQIINLVEEFIICSLNENADPFEAEAYRKKLIKRAEEFIEELKANHNKALINIDTNLYLKDILDALKSVPLPNEKTLQEEADEIYVATEIDKWFSELPIIQNGDFRGQLIRKRLVNNLAKLILHVEKGSGNTESDLDNSLKHEISQFLRKSPLLQGQSIKVNSMIDELIKRLKNRPSVQSNGKKVVFDEPGYGEFSKNMPLCSTCAEQSPQKMDTSRRSIASTKTIETAGSSQLLHSGHYHNISKPLFDDLRLDQNGYKTDLSLRDIPNYEAFDNKRPRSSSINEEFEPQWYTLQESRREHSQSIIPPNTGTQNRTEQSNKSIQAISPSQKPGNRYYHNIAKPLLDDLRLDYSCCNDEQPDRDTTNAGYPSHSSMRDSKEQNWHTLQESTTESKNLQYRNQTSHFVPYPVNTEAHDGEQYNAENYEIPQQYEETIDYGVRKRPDISHHNQRPKRASEVRNEDIGKRNDINNIVDRRRHNSGVNLKSYNDSPRQSQRQRSMDQVPIRHNSLRESNTHVSYRAPGFQTVEEQRSRSSQQNKPDFYKSTDKDGIKQTIERNKAMDVSIDNSSEHLSRYYQPSIIIYPPGFIPLRVGTQKNPHLPDQEEGSEEENDERQGIRCRCVEMLRNKRRIRYCPFDQHDGYPMCLTPPYFYPYYY